MMLGRAGQFGLGDIGGWTGRWIGWGQWINGDASPFEHAFVFVHPAGDAVEAMPGGAVLTNRWQETPSVATSSFNLPADRRARVGIEALALRGTRYSFADYGSLALARLHIRPRLVRDRVAGSGHMICSQLVDEAYLRAGVHLYADGRLCGDVTPGDLWRDFIRDRRQPARIDP